MPGPGHKIVRALRLPDNKSLDTGWLPLRHDCCSPATLSEHLTVIPPSPCARRYLATPLDEIIPSKAEGHGAREGEGKSCFSGSNKSGLGKQVRDGRQDQYQEQTAEPSCDGGPGTGAASLVSLCHGADHPADSPAFGRRRVMLERGRAL